MKRVFLLLLLVPSLVWAAPTVIGTPASGNIGATSGSTLNVTATCPNTGTNRLAIACVNIRRGAAAGLAVTSVLWNSVAMTSAGTPADTGTDGSYAFMYYLKNPTCDGSSHTLAITITNSHMIVGNVLFLQDVDQTTPLDGFAINNAAVSSSPTNSVTSQVGDLVVDCVAARNSGSNLTVGAGQTLATQNDTTSGTGSANIEGSQSYETTAASPVTMSWGSTSVNWASSAVNVNAAVTVIRKKQPPRRYD